MKATSILTIYFSYFLLLISKGKLMTKTAKKMLENRRIERQKKNQEIQKKLDEEHAFLRGWTSENYENAGNQDKAREARLQAEIARTQTKYCTRKGGVPCLG